MTATVVAMPGIVAVMRRDLTNMQHVYLEGEAIDNGISVDSDGGIYVVTSKFMRELVWNGERLSANKTNGGGKANTTSSQPERVVSGQEILPH